VGAEPMPLGFGARLTWEQRSEAKVEHLLAAAVKSWAQLLQTETKAV